MPAGLVLSGDGQLSGTPTTIEGSPFSVGFEVTDRSTPPQTATKTLRLTVSTKPLEITTTGLPSGLVNTAYSALFAASGGVPPYAWAVPRDQLPSGLSLNSSTGEISGVPTVPSTGNLEVSVLDSGHPPGTASKALVLAINPVGPFIRSLTPATANAGGPPFVLFVNGTNFQPGAKLLWNGNEKLTHVNDSANLFANIEANDLDVPSPASVTVVNPSDPSHPSNGVPFPISSNPNPLPQILLLLPDSAPAGSPDLTFHVTGKLFCGRFQNRMGWRASRTDDGH